MITHFLRFISPSLSIMICGHFSREELDAASLANTVINVLGLSIDMGFSTASDTLFSQTYGSSKRKLMGIILQRALLIMTLIFLTLACVHVNIEGLLLMAGQDSLISSLAAEYVLAFLPGLYCDYLFMTLSRYLTSQNRVQPMVIAACSGTIFTLLSQSLVFKLDLGLRASASFLSMSFAVMLLCEVLYIFIYRIYAETWDGKSMVTFMVSGLIFYLLTPVCPFLSVILGWDFVGALSEWGIFFRLGIPGILMIAFEEWCLELSTFIAGRLFSDQSRSTASSTFINAKICTMSDAILGAQTIVFQIQSIIYMVPLGICTAVNVRVGQGLGAFDPRKAKHTYRTALLSIFGFVFLTAAPVVLLRHKIPYLFTTDKEVIDEAVKLFPVLLIFQFCEGLGGVSEAVLLACGRQVLGAITIFVGYYLIGLPLGLLLTYKFQFGIIGMWIGLATGFFLTDCIYTFVAIRTDWMEESRRFFFNTQALRNVRQNSNSISVRSRTHTALLAVDGSRNRYPTIKMDTMLDEKQPQPTAIRSNSRQIFLRITISAVVLVFFLCNLWYRLFHTTPYWVRVCRDPAASKPKGKFCNMLSLPSRLLQ
ncbi:unnamed protein product [Mesocestoides corti]|uniref:Multidrug and toxin extrusion protein n=1 Tax=Mesocestoides corti TaxID=53468 RepID=A0A158QTL5_MESCO|nr:unnamed protein product [Mesocestoides corti]